jgi:predicted RND superfamily exporter protein
LPALRNFCFYAAFGILFTFFFQVTWFVAWLTMDEWRRAANRRDVACCLTVPKDACCVCCAPRADGRTKMGRWMGDTLGGALTDKKVKAGVLVAFAAVAAGGFAGCALMQIDADVNDFIPGGSYLKEWIADSNSMYRSLGDGIDVYTRDMDVHTETGAATLLAASAAFRADPYVADASVVSWIEAFNAYRGAAGAFAVADLFAFVTSASGASFYDDIVWVNETGTAPLEGIQVTRMRGNHIKTDSSNEKVKSMDSLRASLASVAGNEDGKIFAFSSAWLNYEQYKAIEVEAIRNISSTMAVMVVIIAFLLVNPKAVAVVCFCLCLIIVNIIGYMHFWDLSLDSVTIIMLIIALGLSVDYAAHIGRAFMEVHGTPDERLRMCLENMGVAVFNGAVSTFLAVLLLGGSASYVFITFFRQLFLCIVFGLAHGLVLLPVLMSIVNPKPYAAGAFGH